MSTPTFGRPMTPELESAIDSIRGGNRDVLIKALGRSDSLTLRRLHRAIAVELQRAKDREHQDAVKAAILADAEAAL